MTSSAFDSSRQGCGSGQCACRRAAQTRRADPFDDTDYGTPTRHADTDVTLDIDGRAVTVPAGTSVMRAAIEAGINVPKLCATDSLEPFGSCRLCLVEIEGRRGYPASCTTPVEAGMKVRTQSDRLQALRRNVMELYISDHPLDCLTCAANGDCELQDMAGAVGLREVRYGFDGKNHLSDAKDESNPYFSYDPSKCIVCNRCVRACEETQGTFALTIASRGFESRVAASAGEAFMDSECVSCGACVAACPTATLIEKSVARLGQPEHEIVTTCAYCGVGCALKAEMKGEQVVRMTPHKNGLANEGHACVKGRFAWGYATHKDRITKPMIREKITDAWREVSWDEAIGYAAARFRRIQDEHGRDSIGGITSSRCTNEETYLVQKLVRAAFGNNNVDTCARVCHSPTGYGLKTTLGESAGTQTFASVGSADVIVVIGANPTDGHPVFGSRLKRRVREGAQLIVVDPRRIDLVDGPHVKAVHHLQLRPGTNVALVNALAHVIVTEGLVDEAFVAERCEPQAFDVWRVRRAAREFARGDGGHHGRAGRRGARRRAPVRDGRARGDFLRARRDRARAGLDDGDGHREPRDGDGQSRHRRRGREPAARAEQRAGLVRHGFVPARAARLPAHRRRRGARASTKRGRRRCSPSPACAFRTCSMRRSTAVSRGSIARARTSSSPIRTRSTSRPRWRRSTASSCRTSS